jgi:cell division initiation protein
LNISPLDVRNQVFRRKVRGYDIDEVRMFLDAVADCMEQMLKEKENLEKDVALLSEKADAFTGMESTLRETMVTAQRVGDDAKANARKEAENIIKEAELDAKRKVSAAARKVEELEKDRETAQAQTMAFVAKLRSLLEAQLSFLGSIESEIRAEEAREGKGAGVCEEAT